MSSKNINTALLQHLNYLRSLHLESPRMGNVFLEDQALVQYTNHIFGFANSQNGKLDNKFQEFYHQLVRLGDRFAGTYLAAARNAQQNEPRLEQFDTYGRRIDKLHLSEGWKQQAKFAGEDGIVALAYEKDKYKLGEMQRLGQLMVLYMYHPSSGLYGCPLAMTDGAAYTIRSLLSEQSTLPEVKQSLSEAYQNLTSRQNMWTSGQWMTEKKGGSDVSNTETIAVHSQNNNYKLYGYKWFTSATDSNMSLGLAKVLPEGMEPTVENIRKLKVSLFYLKMRNPEGQLNNMEIIRLKDKFGTRQLPTAQLLLKGTQAQMISKEGLGVKTISKMLTITRIYNSATAVGLMRKGLALAKDYSARRTIGRTKLNNLPLQKRVLSHLQVIHRGNLMFYLRISEIFSKEQAKTITEHQANFLRVMTPLMKLFTGKQVLGVLTEVLESFGGMGYIEGSMLPGMLRDAQVLSIWEGTTNVLCHDFVRAILKKENSFMPLESLKVYFLNQFNIFRKTDLEEKPLLNLFEAVIMSYNSLFTDLNKATEQKYNSLHMAELRAYTFGLSHIFIAVQLIKFFLSTNKQTDFQIAKRWVLRGLYRKEGYCTKKDEELSRQMGESKYLGQDLDSRGKPRSRL